MARTKTTITEKKASAADLLGSLVGKPKSASTSKTPTISLTNPVHVAAVKAIIQAKEDKKQAESALSVAEVSFKEDATTAFEKKCRDDRNVHSSVRFVGQDVSLLFTQPSALTKMSEDEVSEPLRAIFGNDFSTLFHPKRTIEINTEKLTDNQIVSLITAMQAALKDSFSEVVTVDKLVVPYPEFFEKRVLDDRIRQLYMRANEEGLVNMKSSFFKQ